LYLLVILQLFSQLGDQLVSRNIVNLCHIGISDFCSSPYKSLFRRHYLAVSVSALQAGYADSSGLCSAHSNPCGSPWHNKCLASFAKELPRLVWKPDTVAHSYLFGQSRLLSSKTRVFFAQSVVYQDAYSFPCYLLCPRP